MFILFSFLISLVISNVERVIGLPADLSGPNSFRMPAPSIAVPFRRLHETCRSGWWALLSFVPLLGALAIQFFTAQEGEASDNAYGAKLKV
jgi:uncharacterized membrane protein YhaH (DUF805 family)